MTGEFEGERTIAGDAWIADYPGGDFLSRSDVLPGDKMARGVYLAKILLLSRRRSFVGGIASGSVAALNFNGNKYEEKRVFNLGFYK